MSEPTVAVLMGSESDTPKLEPAFDTLREYAVPFEARVLSAHRSPDLVAEYVKAAPSRGTKVFVCAAGMAAHLAGAVAANTHLPVIGIPIRAGALEGHDALLSTVQMPPGVPVATVAIDGAKNAALLAIQMLALSDERLAGLLQEKKRAMAEAMAAKPPIV
ncbi:MAG: 5-(carboxyamino)imidazole ribonucleotide mutase [Fimbriimonadia bacterium]|jgi:5-(carboxyamino)imidazole ribonucleotide mutase